MVPNLIKNPTKRPCIKIYDEEIMHAQHVLEHNITPVLAYGTAFHVLPHQSETKYFPPISFKGVRVSLPRISEVNDQYYTKCYDTDIFTSL